MPTPAIGMSAVQGTVDVGNLPATQKIAGNVGIDTDANTVKVGNFPTSQQLQARWLSVDVYTPAPACTVSWVRVTQLGNDGGAGSFAPATKVGAREWVASDEVLVPNAASAVVSAQCPEDDTIDYSNRTLSVNATVAGDLFPAP